MSFTKNAQRNSLHGLKAVLWYVIQFFSTNWHFVTYATSLTVSRQRRHQIKINYSPLQSILLSLFSILCHQLARDFRVLFPPKSSFWNFFSFDFLRAKVLSRLFIAKLIMNSEGSSCSQTFTNDYQRNIEEYRRQQAARY